MKTLTRILATLIATMLLIGGFHSPADAAKPFKARVVETKSGKLKVKITKKASGVVIKKKRVVKINKARTKARIKVKYVKYRKVRKVVGGLRGGGRSVITSSNNVKIAPIVCSDLPTTPVQNEPVPCYLASSPSESGMSFVDMTIADNGEMRYVLDGQLPARGENPWVLADANGTIRASANITMPNPVVEPPKVVIELLPEVFVTTQTLPIQ